MANLLRSSFATLNQTKIDLEIKYESLIKGTGITHQTDRVLPAID
jgi:hypothetical protein